MMEYLKLLRPHQYLKNLFLFFPLFFALRINDLAAICDLTLAFLGFSLLASSVYILNDYRDREEDGLHPVKCRRPLASGTVNPGGAIVVGGLLLMFGIACFLSFSSWTLMILVFAYLLLNLGYSFGLKKMAIIDVNLISIGFVLRLFVGGEVAHVELSIWIVMMTYLLALFLALAKRRDDVVILLESGRNTREAIKGYDLQFLDSTMMLMSSVIVVCYLLYTVSPEIIDRSGGDLYLTSIFVVIGVLRYLQITLVYKMSGSPTKVLITDHPLQVTLLLWLLSFALIIYL